MRVLKFALPALFLFVFSIKSIKSAEEAGDFIHPVIGQDQLKQALIEKGGVRSFDSPREGIHIRSRSTWVLFDFGNVIFPLGGYSKKYADKEMLKTIKALGKDCLVGGLTARNAALPNSKAKSDLKKRTKDLIGVFNPESIFGLEGPYFNFLSDDGHWFKDGHKDDLEFPGKTCFWKGIMFTGKEGGMSKGDGFKILHRKAKDRNYRDPKVIIMIDDSSDHLRSVKEAIDALYVGNEEDKPTFVGILYLPTFKTIRSAKMYKFASFWTWFGRRIMRSVGG